MILWTGCPIWFVSTYLNSVGLYHMSSVSCGSSGYWITQKPLLTYLALRRLPAKVIEVTEPWVSHHPAGTLRFIHMVAGFQKQQKRISPTAPVLFKSLLALHLLTCCWPNHMAENMLMSLLLVAEESLAFISKVNLQNYDDLPNMGQELTPKVMHSRTNIYQLCDFGTIASLCFWASFFPYESWE